ncbi:DUF768 domain-containing protein [Mesorhizobium sp. B2-6-5]|uniref:DUF768 domain-containing protein n=1 Tax=Mesorhizobium sp. B2-6-5 TaxID=2589912 RepID=UPI00112AC8D0|nr:DUF768 domain-containing protein [Mesorhizobium sp. B2-6-5]TPJ32740.1 DUF768 domain-containing protein [Mesorhizobium sp. B2-6-5]
MSRRAADFLREWICDHLPTRIDDAALVVTTMAADAVRAAEAQGIARQEIDREIGSVYEATMRTLQDRTSGLPD